MIEDIPLGLLGQPMFGGEATRLTSAQKYVRGIIPDSENRAEHDFYRTPEIGTRCLLAVEKFRGLVWEPACGDGAIAKVLEGSGLKVYATDLIDRGYGIGGKDFLGTDPPERLSSIVTNPPFNLMQEFVERALTLAPYKVAVLARLLWLEGRSRSSFFKQTPLARVWIFPFRLNVAKNGFDYGDGGIGGMVAFCWLVWQRGWKGAPRLGWLPLP